MEALAVLELSMSTLPSSNYRALPASVLGFKYVHRGAQRD